MTSWYEYQKLFFDFDFPSPRYCRLKTWNFTSGHVKNRAKGDRGIVTLWRYTRNGVNAKNSYVGRIAEILNSFYFSLFRNRQIKHEIMWN